mmetsp:Transcript_36457/g.116860  ORF Transcript_36457/g.116860 Transcript_36457/m.116860 type:complete len:212 (-) Transcript_36457:1856-2491(-)
MAVARSRSLSVRAAATAAGDMRTTLRPSRSVPSRRFAARSSRRSRKAFRSAVDQFRGGVRVRVVWSFFAARGRRPPPRRIWVFSRRAGSSNAWPTRGALLPLREETTRGTIVGWGEQSASCLSVSPASWATVVRVVTEWSASVAAGDSVATTVTCESRLSKASRRTRVSAELRKGGGGGACAPLLVRVSLAPPLSRQRLAALEARMQDLRA